MIRLIKLNCKINKFDKINRNKILHEENIKTIMAMTESDVGSNSLDILLKFSCLQLLYCRTSNFHRTTLSFLVCYLVAFHYLPF